jgi:hypothetical protein
VSFCSWFGFGLLFLVAWARRCFGFARARLRFVLPPTIHQRCHQPPHQQTNKTNPNSTTVYTPTPLHHHINTPTPTNSYIAMYQLIAEEFSREDLLVRGRLRAGLLLGLAAGAACMCVLAIWS